MSQNNITVASISFNWNHQIIDQWPKEFRDGVFNIAYAIKNQAQENAPVVTAALQNSIRVLLRNEDEIQVIAGGTTAEMSFPPKNALSIVRVVDYAAKVEEKSTRPHYMKRAQETVLSGDWMQKYFGDITK